MGREIESGNLRVIIEPNGAWTIVTKRNNTVVLTTGSADRQLKIFDETRFLWPLVEVLELVFSHHKFPPEEMRALAAAMTPENISELLTVFKTMATGTGNVPNNKCLAMKALLGLIEDDTELAQRGRAEASSLTDFLAPFGATAMPEPLTPSIAEIHAQYQARVARDLCGYDGNCLWWVPGCTNNWGFWRHLGWSSADNDRMRKINPEDTQPGMWILWTPVIQIGDPEAVMQKIREAMNLHCEDIGMVRNAAPSQLLYLLRRAEKKLGKFPLRDDESLVTTANAGWFPPKEVRILRVTATSRTNAGALNAALPGGNAQAFRTAAVDDRTYIPPPEMASMAPLELLLSSKAPQGYVDGIMPICFVK